MGLSLAFIDARVGEALADGADGLAERWRLHYSMRDARHGGQVALQAVAVARAPPRQARINPASQQTILTRERRAQKCQGFCATNCWSGI